MNEYFEEVIKCQRCGKRYCRVDLDAMDDMGMHYLYKGDSTFYCPGCWERYKQKIKEQIENG